MEGQDILRPARLFSKWPRARQTVDELKQHINFECIAKHAAVVRSVEDCQIMYNNWVDQFPADQRHGLHTITFDLLDEVARNAVWARFGRQTFLIGAGVQAELMRSVSGEVRVDDIEVPYPAFYVGFENQGPRIGSGYLEGLMVRSSKTQISVSLCISPLPEQPSWKIDPVFTVELKRGSALTVANAISEYSNQIHQKVADLEVAIENGIASLKSKDTRFGTVAVTSARQQAEAFADAEDEIASATEFAANVLCLLASPHDSLLSQQEWFPKSTLPIAKKNKAEHLQRGAIAVRWLKFEQSQSDGNTSGTLGAISPRAHWRRGHFRRQPYGPKGDATFRPKWIRPVLVNPENGSPAERSEYRVEV
jgi:hypothetical protein